MRLVTKTVTAVILLTSATLFASGGKVLEGYVLFSGSTTYLINNNKEEVHKWTHGSSGGGYCSYLLPSGNLLRPGTSTKSGLSGAASSGLVQEFDKQGNVVWEFEYKSSNYVTHHDLEPMPNGNVLAIAWEKKTAAEATTAGFTNKPSGVNPDHIIEIAPPSNGQPARIVWEWHAWDHLTTATDKSQHPELFSVDLGGSSGGGGGFGGGADWMHVNGIGYNPEIDQIVFSSHFFNEIYVIDHGTTTEEAKGHTGGKQGKGGDILFRWGCPSNFGGQGTKFFYVVHSAHWIPANVPGGGHLFALNNGTSDRKSIPTEVVPPCDATGAYPSMVETPQTPAAPEWTFSNSSFFSQGQGSVQRLPNGNTFLNESNGEMFEVTPAGDIVWQYSPSKGSTRAQKYAADYPGITKLLGISSTENCHGLPADKLPRSLNIAADRGALYFTAAEPYSVTILSLDGKRISSLNTLPEMNRYQVSFPAPGAYLLDAHSATRQVHRYFTINN